MASRRKPGILRGLHPPCRALAEGAMEHEPLAGGFREFVQHAAAPMFSCTFGYGDNYIDGNADGNPAPIALVKN